MRATTTKQQMSGIRAVLEENADKLTRTGSVRPGRIVVHSGAETGPQYRIECSTQSASVSVESAPAARAPGADLPTVELIGDLKQIEGVLSGKKDARKHFLAGGFRLRGDLRYASEIGMALGILKEPL